jgi:hypothetical protein
MTRRIKGLTETTFIPVCCGPECDDGMGNILRAGCGDPRACKSALFKNGGFWSPFIDI